MLNPFESLDRIRIDGTPTADTIQANEELRSQSVKAGYDIASTRDAAILGAKTRAEQYKAQQKANEPSGLEKALGFAGTAASIAAPFIALCERRLKQQIQSLDDRSAWQTVRDLPLYQFEYRHRPGVTVYGPMVDEVAAIDPSLVVPMDVEAHALGIHDGQPVRGIDVGRRQAYESMALQQALRRIEALESRLLQLEAALHPELVIGDGGTSAAVPCWGGLDELPALFGA
jgi:hypothetical protein